MLASASPRRRELLRSLGLEFDVVSSGLTEALEPGPLPDSVARLALGKARAVARQRPDAVVLGADTVVVVDGEALGKPADAGEARAILRRLCGRAHEVITGVAVVDGRSGREVAEAVVTRVFMADYDEVDIAAYVASGEPLDKAGAYAIQERGAGLVAGFAGSYTNVIGLPLAVTRRLLAEAGVLISAAAP